MEKDNMSKNKAAAGDARCDDERQCQRGHQGDAVQYARD